MLLKKPVLNLSASTIKAAERLLRGGRIQPGQTSSVLILEYMLPLGCCVHLTPVYEAIKRAHPQTVLTVATRGLGAALLQHHRYIDYLIETPDPLTDLSGAARVLRSRLKAEGIQPDCTLTGVSDQRTRIALLALLTGAGWRGGYTLASRLYHRPLERKPELSLIDNNLRLAVLAGATDSHLEPRVFFSPADVDAMTALVRQFNPEGRPLAVMVTQNSGGQRTGWHDERFAQVIRHVHDAMGCAVVYVGTGADEAAIEQIRLKAGAIGVSLAGRTSVTELAGLLAMSDYAVSLDTGTMHIGRAVGVPMVVIGPSWQKPLEWLPLGLPQVRILRGEDRSDIPENYRLDEVEASAVIDAFDDLIKAYPPGPEDRSERLRANMSEADHRRGPQA